MNKAELVLEIQKELGKEATKAQAERALEAVLGSIKKGVKKDKVVQLIGFGTFKTVQRAARMGINPQTRAAIKIKASKTIRFTVSSALKSAL